MSMPEQKPGRSKQDYGTPPEFLEAVKRRLHIREFALDIAADDNNTVAHVFYNEESNALLDTNPWSLEDGSWSWLNPPFGKISSWASKAVRESKKGAQIAMLVPASVGANWWFNHVEPYAYQVYLNGRLTFIGETAPYPKDCALLLYTPWGYLGHEIWHWRRYMPELSEPRFGQDQRVPTVLEMSLENGL